MTAPTLPRIKGYRGAQVPQYTPEQMQMFQQSAQGIQPGVSSGLDYYSRLAGGDQSMFGDIEAPAYEAFNKLLGQVGSRFSQYGARDSSAFQNAVSGAGSELAMNLASQRNALRQQAIDKLLSQQQFLLGQRPYEAIYAQKQQKQGMDWGKILSAAGPIIGGMLAGPPGAIAGGAASGAFGALGGGGDQNMMASNQLLRSMGY